jgi:predicted ribosome quality control (RQC) complex YloA/Tae2 family protein
MTAYEYDNLPEELNVEALPEELFKEGIDAFTQALASDALEAKEIKIAYVYDRKGYINVDAFAGKRKTGYSSESDDVVIQVTLRVRNPKHRAELSNFVTLGEHITERNLKAERARLEAEIAQAEATAEKAEATAREAREKLEALRKK